MILDKSIVEQGVKLGMSSTDKARQEDIELAMILCLDDLANKLKSKSHMLNYDVTVSVDDRTKTLTGNNNDLKYIFAIKYGTGTEQVLMTYIDQKKFFVNYDSPSATSGTPSVFTILSSSEGFPIVKFNVPADSATTMTVYYYPDITPDNISFGRSAGMIVVGTKAYFYGIETDRGNNLYQQYKELVMGSRAGDHFMDRPGRRFEMSQADQDIRTVIKNIKNLRSR